MEEAKEVYPGITVDPQVRFGKPVLKGTRIDVALILDLLSAGTTPVEFMRQYHVDENQIRTALGYAAQVMRHKRPRRRVGSISH